MAFLDHFLQDAHSHWESHLDTGLYSGVWQEGEQKERYFEAIAISIEAHKLLLIHQLDLEHWELPRILQEARHRTLSHRRELRQQQDVQIHLGKRLDASEQQNQDLLSLLNQLHVGTLLINPHNTITFINKAGERLVGVQWSNQPDTHWKNLLPLQSEELSALADMGNRPTKQRESVSVRFPGNGAHVFSVDIDIKDDPRVPEQKIWFLYDRTEVLHLRQLLDDKNRFHNMVGKGKPMQRVFQRIQEIGRVDSPVLIGGETGTGKELVARALHQISSRQNHPFIPVNCAGLTDSLLGSQLFGHKRGAFTGAFEDHRGFFETAEQGTIFLDEIGDMPLPVQASLLRILQEKEIIRLGESKPRHVNVRVMAATNRNLQHLVTEGKFRADLLYRIRVARIDLPPLRDRREDIPLLASLFLKEAQIESGKSVETLHPEALQCLLRYGWPGNVRELKGAIDFAVIHCPTRFIRAQDLPPEILEFAPTSSTSSTHERDTILKTLEQVNGNRAAAARLLGISRATFYRRLNELASQKEK